MERAPTIWNRIGSRIRGAFVKPDDPRHFQQWVQLLDQPAGVSITADNALEISAVWACVMAIVNAIAPAQWTINTRTYNADGSSKLQRWPNDPLHYVLNVRPNPDMTAVAFRQAQLISRLLWGNSYACITKTASGKVAELWPLLPHRTLPRRDPTTGLLYYEYHSLSGGEVTRLEQDEVLHHKGPGISGLMGDHVVARAAKSMGLAAAAERFASTYFGNNTVIGGVLSAPFKFPRDPLGKSNVADRIRDDWAAMHQGPNKAFRPAILEGGMTWTPLTTNAVDAQLVEVRKFSIEEIARWFGVPGHMIGIAASAQGYGKNLEELSLGFVRNTLSPICVEMEQEADYKLISQRRLPQPFTKVDLAPLSHGDAASRAAFYEKMVGIGVYSVNEVRAFEGENHIGPDGDVRVVSTMVQTVDKLINPPPPPAPAGAEPADAGAEDAGPGDVGDGGAVAQVTSRLRAVAIEHYALAFSRNERRLSARRADLERAGLPPAEVEEKVKVEQEKSAGLLLLESNEVTDALELHPQAVRDALASVIAGAVPHEAASALLERSNL